MAKYRYLPRIFRAWIATSELGPQALKEKDWEGLQIVWERLDDATTALPLYTNAVEGSRSGKRKKKTDAQKELIKATDDYKTAVADLKVAIDKKNTKKVNDALERVCCRALNPPVKLHALWLGAPALSPPHTFWPAAPLHPDLPPSPSGSRLRSWARTARLRKSTKRTVA